METNLLGDIKEVGNSIGTQEFADGNKYVGSIKDLKYNGYGRVHYIDGTKYAGSWEDGQYHGSGQLILNDESRYKGTWKMGIKHGSFVYTDIEGQESTQEWKYGKRINLD